MPSASRPAPPDLILAADWPEREAVERLLDTLGTVRPRLKVGLQLFTRYGPELVREWSSRAGPLFLDLKLHDIPNTVGRAVESLARLPIEYLTLHALGGRRMLEAAVAARDAAAPGLRLLAVTVLTSHAEADLPAIGIRASAREEVLQLGTLAHEAGVDGLVCSPHEVAPLRARLGSVPDLVVPGIRPAGTAAGDQQRVLGPEEALAAGATHLVVGRPILEASDPAAAYHELKARLRRASAGGPSPDRRPDS
jgi:orotidine-5'-phosphate decarboxylase